jgi:hypothetical protein
MAERNPPSLEEIKGLIERVDEVCRESQRVRDQANHSMRRQAFWPERRRTVRLPEPSAPPDKEKDST